MRSPFAYARRPGPLGSAGPGAAAAYLGSLALIALALGNPLLIAAAGVAAVLAGIISSAGVALAGAWRWALALGVLMVLVNALVVRRGDTVLIRGFDLPVLGSLDITLEALAEGGVLALRVIVVLLAFAVLSACVDPDRMLGAVRPLARRSALTATLITRLVPLAGRDHARLREAAGSRGPAAADVGRGPLVSRLVAGSLERASDVAATIELRGYGLRPAEEPTGSSPAAGPRSRSARNDSSVLLYGLAATTLAIGLIAGMNGLAGFEAYPTIEIAVGPATIAVALLIALLPVTLLPLRSVMPARRWPLAAAHSASEPSAGPPGRRRAGEPCRPVLEIAELSYRYPGQPADCLDRVDVSVSPGELVLLGGPSGSGKTSLLRAACGLIPHFHGGTIAGRIVVAGREVREHGPAELAAAVGYVAQDPETQVVSAIAGSEIEMPLVSRSVADPTCKLEVAAVAAELGISELLERPTDSLSAGELQRVAIAAALVSGPRLLLLDEPTSQLDPGAADALIGAVGRLRARGTAIIVAEHRMDRWLTLADRGLLMDSEQVVHADPAAGATMVLGSRGQAAPSVVASTGSLLVKPTHCGAASLAPGDFRDLSDPAEPVGPIKSGESVEPIAAALHLADVSLTLDSGRPPVLQHVDVRVERGERVALLGANGAGKSSLLRVAASLVAPSSGSSGAPGGCALLGQHPGDYLVRDRVADELPGELGAQALNAVGLGWAAEMEPRDLSGGERQRLALALTLAGRGLGGSPPGLVCLDEPTRGMDSERKAELAALIRRLSDDGAAVVVATHDLAFAASFAERAIVIERGTVAADCDFQDLPGPAGLHGGSEPVPSRRLGGDPIGAGIAVVGSGELT